MVSEYIDFIKELPRSFTEIGAMLPSSPALAKLMVQPIVRQRRPLRILEVGPGTGPFTRAILELMRETDTFTICEINHRFMDRLEASLARNPHFRRNAERVTFYRGPIQNYAMENSGAEFDVIISSLPFLNLEPETVDELFELFLSLCADDASLTFFHYLGLPTLAHFLPNAEVKKRVKAVEQVIKRWRARAKCGGYVSRRASFLNIPPAVAEEFHFQRPSALQ